MYESKCSSKFKSMKIFSYLKLDLPFQKKKEKKEKKKNYMSFIYYHYIYVSFAKNLISYPTLCGM